MERSPPELKPKLKFEDSEEGIIRAVGRCRDGSSVSVSVSPAHAPPGVVQMTLIVSSLSLSFPLLEPRAANPNIRLLKLCELLLLLIACLEMPFVLPFEDPREVYIMPSSSPLTSPSDSVSELSGEGIRECGRE